MTQLNKIAFKHFVEGECERRLFWDLCVDDPSWMSPVRKLAKPEFVRQADADLGHLWEQKVYVALRQLPGAHAEVDAAGDVTPTHANAASFLAIVEEAKKQPVILLEYQWAPPEKFYRFVLGVAAGHAMPVALPAQHLRPDVHVVSRVDWANPREVCPDGTVRYLTPEECDTRLAIRIVDVKHTNEHGIGRSHFVELLFYAHALSFWLVEQGLEEQFFVSPDGNGIFPCVELPQGALTVDKMFQEVLVLLSWDSSKVLFARTCDRIRSMTARRPFDVDTVSVRIQPACGACAYLTDCKASLKRGKADPGEWDLRLLPYVSTTTAEVLRNVEKLDTINDVANKLTATPSHSGYDPLFAERPLLKLKAKAVIDGKRIPITGNVLDGQRNLNMLMPRYDDQTILFNLEADRTHDVVFGAALRFESRCASFTPYKNVYEAWWAKWQDLLNTCSKHDEFVTRSHEIIDALDPEYVASLPADEAQRLINVAARALWVMKENGDFQWATTATDANGVIYPIRVSWGWQYVSDGVEPSDEFELVQDLLRNMMALIGFCDAMEMLVGVWVVSKTNADEKYRRSPRLACFYWAQDQVEHAQDMLERHIGRLNANDTLRAMLHHLLLWLNPAESQVASSERYQKVFDLFQFVQTTQAVPHIINITWHEMLSPNLIGPFRPNSGRLISAIWTMRSGNWPSKSIM